MFKIKLITKCFEYMSTKYLRNPDIFQLNTYSVIPQYEFIYFC